MSIDVMAATGGGLRARLDAWLRRAEVAMDTGYEDVQDRRIAALERDVAELRRRLDASETL